MAAQQATPANKLIKALGAIQNDATKVIDVSKIDAEGKGFKTIPVPKRAGKYAVPQYPVIVSDNAAAYNVAMHILGVAQGSDYSALVQEYVNTFGQGKGDPINAQREAKKPKAVKGAKRVRGAPMDAEKLRTKFLEAYAKAEANGKVLDVSEFNPNGTGLRAVNVPKSSQGTRKWIDPLRIISNNYTSYYLAVQLLGPEYEAYAAEFHRQFGEGKHEQKKGGPGKISVRSPGTLADVPYYPSGNDEPVFLPSPSVYAEKIKETNKIIRETGRSPARSPLAVYQNQILQLSESKGKSRQQFPRASPQRVPAQGVVQGLGAQIPQLRQSPVRTSPSPRRSPAAGSPAAGIPQLRPGAGIAPLPRLQPFQ